MKGYRLLRDCTLAVVLLSLVSVVAVAGDGGGLAKSVVSFDQYQANAEGAVQIPISVENLDPVAGIQIELTLDPDLISVKGVEAVDRAAGMQVAHNLKGDRLVMLLYDLQAKAVSAGSGPVMRVTLQLTNPQGPDVELNLDKVLLATKSAESIPVEFERRSIVISALVPATYALHQNYPNPFNPQTQLRFELPETAQTRLVVYNLRGQAVATLVDDLREAGFYSATWDGLDSFGRPVASGVYFARLTAGTFSTQMKLVLLR